MKKLIRFYNLFTLIWLFIQMLWVLRKIKVPYSVWRRIGIEGEPPLVPQWSVYQKRKEIAMIDKIECITNADGTRCWYLNGQLHREDGPAVEYAGGARRWYLNGQLHREDGPAVEYADGTRFWYRHDKLHREDGPAVERADGARYWCRNGVFIKGE